VRVCVCVWLCVCVCECECVCVGVSAGDCTRVAADHRTRTAACVGGDEFVPPAMEYPPSTWL
jgi:hypothetical protein